MTFLPPLLEGKTGAIWRIAWFRRGSPAVSAVLRNSMADTPWLSAGPVIQKTPFPTHPTVPSLSPLTLPHQVTVWLTPRRHPLVHWLNPGKQSDQCPVSISLDHHLSKAGSFLEFVQMRKLSLREAKAPVPSQAFGLQLLFVFVYWGTGYWNQCFVHFRCTLYSWATPQLLDPSSLNKKHCP